MNTLKEPLLGKTTDEDNLPNQTARDDGTMDTNQLKDAANPGNWKLYMSQFHLQTAADVDAIEKLVKGREIDFKELCEELKK